MPAEARHALTRNEIHDILLAQQMAEMLARVAALLPPPPAPPPAED